MSRLRSFLKSLRFWRYRELYLNLLTEMSGLVQSEKMHRMRSRAALAELKRVMEILAPYGERILTGQAEETVGMIRLPALEFEMAKAHFNMTASQHPAYTNMELLGLGGFSGYCWRGRPVRLAE